MMEQAMKIMEETCELILKGTLLNKFAKIYKKLYDELIKEGFTPEQALKIVSNYSPGGKN